MNREIGDKGAISLEICDCVGCTGVNDERMQRASFSSARLSLHLTGLACLAHARSGAPDLELKEHVSRERQARSMPGFRRCTPVIVVRAPVERRSATGAPAEAACSFAQNVWM